MFAVAISSASHDCLSSVTFVHPSQPAKIFGNVYYVILYPKLTYLLISRPPTSVQNFREIVQWESFRRELRAKGLAIAKYSDVGRFEGYNYSPNSPTQAMPRIMLA